MSLLQIEQAFLNEPAIKNALNLTAIRAAQRSATTAARKKFETTLTLAAHAVAVCEWFDSVTGKAATEAAGIVWNKEAIGLKVFGWQKSFLYKSLKAGKLAAEVVDRFNTLCDEAEAEGESPNRSIEGLLKFAKQVEEQAAAGGEGSGEGEGEGDSEGEAAQPTIETRTATIFTMTFKRPEGGNVSVRIDEAGKVTTTNSPEDIAQAIAFLTNKLTGGECL